MRLYVGLIHYPVYNKNGERIASAVTGFDLHDLSRLARTFGVRRLFVITPLEDQQKLAERIIRHWTEGYGATYNVLRKEAFDLVSISPSLEQCVREISSTEGGVPVLVATDASRRKSKGLTYHEAKNMVRSDQAVLVLFGTGWGLDDAVFEEADYFLDPIEADRGYNHLSVRSAAAIILDRLVGKYH
jgi:tRNA (guanine37-N1)-methyltransferase